MTKRKVTRKKDYLSPREFANKTDFHYLTVLRWLRTGRLQGWQSKRRGHWRIPVQALPPKDAEAKDA